MPRPALAKFATATIEAELARRQRSIPRLERRHQRLLAQAARVAAQIEALGGTSNGALPRKGRRKGSREPRPGSLVHTLETVLRGKTMTVTKAAAAARAAGYKTKSTATTFYHGVYMALANSGRFKRVARGTYTAR